MIHSLRRIDFEHVDGRPGDAGLAQQCWTMPCEMPLPLIAPRVEERNQRARHGIVASGVRTLMSVAVRAGKTEVFECRGPMMLLGSDVVQLVRHGGISLGELAILT